MVCGLYWQYLKEEKESAKTRNGVRFFAVRKERKREEK